MTAVMYASSVRVVAAMLVVLVVPLAGAARAQGQERPAAAVEFSAGWVGFADDGIVGESLVGGAARFYLLPRISVGPEVVYLSGENHNHLIATANLTWDVLPPLNGRPRQLTPYLVVGGGLFQTRESFVNGTFTSSEGAFTAGGGIRAAVGRRMFAGVDARVGWETHVRLTGTIGVQIGR